MRISTLVLDKLLAQGGLTPADRSLYLWMCVYSPQDMRSLARCLGANRETVAASCGRLVETGWLKLVQVGRSKRPHVSAPHAVQLALCEEFEKGYESAPNRGEYLMKRLLDLLVAKEPYWDNARHGSLANPYTGRPLELDRLYHRAKVGFEFNGTDHQQYVPAGGDEAQIMKGVRARDQLKADLCQEAGIELVTIESEHLLPDRLAALIPATLPRRYVDQSGPLWAVITRVCSAYAAKAAQHDKRAGRQGDT
jgi:hypothetical protein